MKASDLNYLAANPELAEKIRLEVTGADLQKFGEHLASKIIDEMKSSSGDQGRIEEKLLTPDQVSEFLGVSKVTLWNMDKRGDTKPIRLGNSKRYRMTDILELINNSEYGNH